MNSRLSLNRVFAASLVLAACGTEPITLTTPDGALRGETDGDTRAFWGIPFARPPVDERRLAPPEPVMPWAEVRDATSAGPPCAQLKLGTEELDPTSSEDCLYLNVWAPERAGRFPVMVWIPGGGYVLGHGAQPGYDGKHLSGSRDVVVVTINYRLGALGFLGHPALRALEGNTGNYGLLDQREALRWVQRNISAFNGDPENVTIFGESAGGGSACMHLVSPGSAGLFERAIVESAPCTSFDMPTRDESEAQGVDLAEELDCSGAAADVVACLRSASAPDVLRALLPNEHFIYGDGVAWYPTVDGVILPDQPAALLANGASASVPIIVGANSDEATAFFAAEFDDDAAARAVLEEVFGAFETELVLGHYPLAPTRKQALIRIVSDALICDARRIARLHTAAGGVAYEYHFTQGFFDPLLRLGAFHTAEIAFVFGNGLGLPIPPAGIPLKNAMQGYWSQFARSGNPNGGGRTKWRSYDQQKDNSIRLDLSVGATSGVRREACDFWDGLRTPASR